MRKTIVIGRIIAVLLSVCFLSGCQSVLPMEELLVPLEEETDIVLPQGLQRAEQVIQPEITEAERTVEPEDVQTVSVDGAQSGLTEEESAKRELVGLTDENIAALKKKQSGRYAYATMDTSLQTLYIEILQILNNREEDIMVSTLKADDLSYVFQCVLNDYPEIFYVKGYVYTKHTLNDEIKKISFSGTYTMTKAEIETARQQIEQAVMVCISGISSDASEYEKVKYIYEYVIEHTEYDLEAPENQNICSVFLYHESVCQGYAKTVQYLLSRIQVFCTLVVGTVENGEGHAWNLVRIDGAYYYVDATWGDASYVLNGSDASDYSDNMPSINYDYLNVATAQMCLTHQINNVVKLPDCVSLDANYYVREGAYFSGIEEEKLKTLFDRMNSGSSYITLKCSDAAVFAEIKQYLIQDNKVFLYLKGNYDHIMTSENPQQLTLSFWL